MGGVGGRIDELEQSRAIEGGRGGGDSVVSIRRQGRRGGGVRWRRWRTAPVAALVGGSGGGRRSLIGIDCAGVQRCAWEGWGAAVCG